MSNGFKLSRYASTLDDVNQIAPGYDIILSIGQSNTMSGSGSDGGTTGAYDATLDAAWDQIKQLGRYDGYDYKIIPAAEPLHHASRVTGKIGHVLSFAKEYVRNGYLKQGRQVCIMPGGWGGTGFSDLRWRSKPADDLYADAVGRVNWIIDNYPGSKLVAILWHQGETDANNSMTAATYTSNLDSLVTALRREIKNASNVPFMTGNMVPYWIDNTGGANAIAIEGVHSTISSRLPYTAYASARVPSIIKKTLCADTVDSIHYDAPGQRAMGLRYFTAFKSALLNSSSTVVPVAPSGVKAVQGDGYIAVSWLAHPLSTSVQQYLVEYKTASSNSWQSITVAYSNAPGYKIDSLTNGTTYNIRVYAVNAIGFSDASTTVNAIPSAFVEKNYDTNNLKLWLDFETGTIADTANLKLAAHPTANTFTTIGTSLSVVSDEQRGKVLNISGASNTDRISISTFTRPASYTICAWVKMSAYPITGQASNILSGIDSVSSALWFSGTKYLRAGHSATDGSFNGSYTDCTSPVQFELNRWTHCAVSFNNTDGVMILYLDGVAVELSNTARNLANTVLQIGNHGSVGNTAGWTTGVKFDDLRCYDRVLGGSEIKEIAGLGTLPTITSGQWHLLMRQDVSTYRFASTLEARSYDCFNSSPTTASAYSILDRYQSYKNGSTWRFKYVLPNVGTSLNNYITWEQSADPFTTYEAISPNGTTAVSGLNIIDNAFGFYTIGGADGYPFCGMKQSGRAFDYTTLSNNTSTTKETYWSEGGISATSVVSPGESNIKGYKTRNALLDCTSGTNWYIPIGICTEGKWPNANSNTSDERVPICNGSTVHAGFDGIVGAGHAVATNVLELWAYKV